MKKLLFLLTGILCLQATAQETRLVTKKTRQHINIPGTRVFLVPPKGYELVSNEDGTIELKKDERHFIRIYDMPGDRYDQLPDYKAAVEKGAGLIFEDSSFRVNGHQARFLFFQEEPGRKLCALLLGDSTFAATLAAVFPSLEKEAEAEIKACFNTVYYDRDRKVDPFYNTVYTIHERESDFKYVKTGKNFLVYSRDGIAKENYADVAVMVFWTLPDTGKTGEELVEDMVQGQKFEITETGLKSNLAVNGHKAYEAWYYVLYEGRKKLLYLLAIPGPQKSVLVQCIAPSDYESELKEFKKLAYTLKFKK